MSMLINSILSKQTSRLFFSLIAGVFLTLMSFSIPQAHASGPTNTTSQAEKAEVIILTASWCHYCTKLRQFLTSNKVKFTEYDIEKSNLGYQLYRSLGGKGIPVVRIGQNVIFGYNPDKLKEILNESGYNLS